MITKTGWFFLAFFLSCLFCGFQLSREVVSKFKMMNNNNNKARIKSKNFTEKEKQCLQDLMKKLQKHGSC